MNSFNTETAKARICYLRMERGELMKSMTCEQLGGACGTVFHADSFEEMSELSKKHGMELREEEGHKKAMKEMMELMKDPEVMKEWYEGKKKEFDSLAKDE